MIMFVTVFEEQRGCMHFTKPNEWRTSKQIRDFSSLTLTIMKPARKTFTHWIRPMYGNQGSRIWQRLSFVILDPGNGIRKPMEIWSLEFKIQGGVRNPKNIEGKAESRVKNPESKYLLDYLTKGELDTQTKSWQNSCKYWLLPKQLNREKKFFSTADENLQE